MPSPIEGPCHVCRLDAVHAVGAVNGSQPAHLCEGCFQDWNDSGECKRVFRLPLSQHGARTSAAVFDFVNRRRLERLNSGRAA